MNWNKEQQFEKEWWGDCLNTFGEEEKQIVYAERMGLKIFHDGRSPYNFDLGGVSVLDIGGGPVSILLKCKNVTGTVMDPCSYPDWVAKRYEQAGIEYMRERGETIILPQRLFDEVWIYNVLQHVDDPARVIKNARSCSKVLRIFEWIENGISEGHPHNLTEKELNKWLGGAGKVMQCNYPTCKGSAYFGVFKGDHYEKI